MIDSENRLKLMTADAGGRHGWIGGCGSGARALVATVAAYATLTAATPAWARWQVELKIDPITDQRKGRAWIENEEGLFQIQCVQQGNWGLAFQPRRQLGGLQEMRDVIFRFDQDPPKRQTWMFFRTFASTIDGSYVVPVVQRLVSARTFTVRARSYSGNHDATFENDGYNEALVSMGGACIP